MLPGAMQENLLCLVCFSQEGKLVTSLVPLNLWESYYKRIAERAYDFWSSYQQPPGEHTLDLINELCEKKPDDKEVLCNVYQSMLQTAPGVNKQFVLGEVRHFVRQQRLRSAIINSVELLEKEQLDDAEKVLSEAMAGTAQLFDSGTKLTDIQRMLSFLTVNAETYSTGIPELDRFDLGPMCGGLHLFIGPPGRGKSWWLINLGKQAILHRKRVVHITLEMSEEQTAQRYCQALFSISKREERTLRTLKFDGDELGRFADFREEDIPYRPSFRDPNIRSFLVDRLTQMKYRAPLVIKQFPTGSLTIAELNAYLDTLWLSEHISPDLLIVDYADLMSIDSSNFRIDLGRIYKQLRGVAVKRVCAAATASQSNREGAGAKLVRGTHVAEDFSKIGTVDTAITYSQTDEEFRLKLARLHVSKCRNDEDRQTVLISQAYKIGQFCLDSIRMTSRYWDAVRGRSDLEASSREVPGEQDQGSRSAEDSQPK